MGNLYLSPERIGLKPEPFEEEIKIRLFIASILGLLLSSAVNPTTGWASCQLSQVNCQLNEILVINQPLTNILAAASSSFNVQTVVVGFNKFLALLNRTLRSLL